MPQPFKTFADTRVMLKAEMSWWGERRVPISGFEKRTDLSSACWSTRLKIQNAKLLTKWRRKWPLSRKWKQRAAEAPRAFSRVRLWPTGTCVIAHGYGNTPRMYQLSFHKHSHTQGSSNHWQNLPIIMPFFSSSLNRHRKIWQGKV